MMQIEPISVFRKNLFPVILCAAMFLLASGVPSTLHANPARSVTLQYDTARQILYIIVVHPSKKPAKHYIKRVEVTKNGQGVKFANYKEQPDVDLFHYPFPLAFSHGDVVAVDVICSMGGTTEGRITIRYP